MSRPSYADGEEEDSVPHALPDASEPTPHASRLPEAHAGRTQRWVRSFIRDLCAHSLLAFRGNGIILATIDLSEPATRGEHMGKIGYLCSYVPKEIIYAFGKTPVRLLPTAAKASEAEAYLPRNFCSLVKVTLASFLEGDANLEAVIQADSCDALRRLNDVWREYVNVEVLHLLDLPRRSTTVSCDYFHQALRRLTETLQERYDMELTAERLGRSVQCYNEQRALAAEMDRRWGEGEISAATYYDLRQASVTDDPESVNGRLRDTLQNSANASSARREASRVMLVGSLLTNRELVEAIEGYGARVVAEDSCLVAREQTAEIPLSDSVDAMLRDLAAAYLNKPPCPRMRDFPRRMEYLSELVSDRGVDGVVASLYKFCDLFMSEYPVLRKTLQEAGVPVLLLEDEGEASLSGQHRTRLEAFLEVLQ
jgi:benzoyl-CoA reductase subunit C